MTQDPVKNPSAVPPLFTWKGESYYRLHGIEKSVIGSRHLFFANDNRAFRQFGPSGLQLDAGSWFAAGTFRNSFYTEATNKLSRVRDLNLLVDYQGALSLKLFCAVRGKPNETLCEVTLSSAEPARHLIHLGSPTDLPDNARLFWHVDARTGGGTLFDVVFCTRTEPEPVRLAVLLRTFGRTTDVKALLDRFASAGIEDPCYASLLERMEFWVLDTTAGADKEYAGQWDHALNLRVLVGPNLGGGGNAGHLLKLFDDACRQSATPPNELLILDDDLSITMESLARYFMFVAYRAQEFICSLPILMKSEPLTVWEDGGFWGRLNFHEGGDYGRKRNLFPNLLKHGTKLQGYAHLDDFAPLNTCEYSTFIFFGLSLKSFRKIGYPVSFFLRGDDIELSLRASEMGLQMITNPNLAAWHEPAHSYGQEYMAILHGIIINLTYSDSDAAFYTRFFEERLCEHMSIDDMVGIELYKSILAELLDPDSIVLSADFQQHYLPVLKRLGEVKQVKVPGADRVRFQEEAARNKTLIVPFVYPGYRLDARKFDKVVLDNHSARAYRELPPVSTAEKLALSQDYLQLLQRLDQEFPALQARWQQRLAEASKESYWAAIQSRYAGETREVYATMRNAAAVQTRQARESAVPAVYGSDARLQSDAELVHARSGELAATNARGLWHALTSRLRPGRGKGGEFGQLPGDFDPEYYLVINPDVKDAGLDPVEHYVRFGRKEGRKYSA